MKSPTFFVLLLSGFILTPAGVDKAAADTAPAALHGKTVVLRWTENRVQRADAGDVRNSTTSSEFRVYVSSAGRLFSRFSRQNVRSGRSNMSEQGPGGNTTVSGVGQGPRTTRFEGRQLVAENAMRSGARRIQADFDGGFRSCTLRVLYGKHQGADLYHRAMDGRMYTIISTDVISPTCSIRDGNLVGSE